MTSYFVGFDIAQQNDYSAVSVIQTRIVPPYYRLRYLERLPRRTPYPEQVMQVVELCDRIGRQYGSLPLLGADVTGFALKPPTEPSRYEQAGVDSTLNSIVGDIRDFPRLKSAMAECRPEVVIHMAAQSVVRQGYADPIETYSSNVMGTVHLLEALRQLGRP